MIRHTIEAGEKPILDIFCDKYLFRIPSYQRPYAWTTEQTSELFDDIATACGEAGNVSNASFLGSIVLIKDPQKPEADVVDGQQRLTTLTILLSVLRDLSDPAFADDVDEYYLHPGRASKGTKDLFLLTLRERDALFFRSLGPVAGQRPLLTDSSLVLEPDFDGFVFRAVGEPRRDRCGKVFLNASWASSSVWG